MTQNDNLNSMIGSCYPPISAIPYSNVVSTSLDDGSSYVSTNKVLKTMPRLCTIQNIKILTNTTLEIEYSINHPLDINYISGDSTLLFYSNGSVTFGVLEEKNNFY